MDEKGRGQEGSGGIEREVLALVLFEHPVRLTSGELREVLGQPIQVEEALEGLIAVGLLRREGEDLVPTAAALRFHQIRPIDPPRMV